MAICNYSSFTLYDCVDKYAYSMADILGEYPVWDTTAANDIRVMINGLVYDFFAYREIAVETPEMFATYAQIRMARTMRRVLNICKPYFDGITGEPWKITGSTDSTSSTERTPDLETVNASSSESKATALTSDTPQVQLSGTENYMTGLSESGSSAESSSTTTSTGTEAVEAVNSATEHAGNAAEQMGRWVAAYPDVVGLIFEGLEPLFMQVW